MATVNTENTEKTLGVTGEQIETSVSNSHTHINTEVLEELTDLNGKLNYKGNSVSGIDFLTDAEMDAIETEIFG